MAKRLCIIEFLLKVINSIFILFGLAIESYGLYCLIKWKKDYQSHSQNVKYEQIALARALLAIDASNKLPMAWLIYFILVTGASIIIISCFGYVGAATRSSFCLCFYSILLVLLFVAQLGACAFMFLNHNWKEDVPTDISGSFNSTYHFFTMNWKIIRWVIVGALAMEVIGLVLALCLRYVNRVIHVNKDNERVVYTKIVRPRVEKKSNLAGPVPSTSGKQQNRPVKQ